MKIIFFDGYCSLCNGLVDFLWKRDRKKILKFASLQGETAKMMNLGVGKDFDPSSVIYYDQGQLYYRSTAILKIFFDLGWPWKVLTFGFALPLSVRDFIYQQVANRRYQIFGRKEFCRKPTPEELDRLLN